MWFFANVVSLMYLITPFSNYVSPKLIFFTGGNSLMPEDIYSSFISKLKAEYDVAVIKNSYVAYGDDNKNSMKLLSGWVMPLNRISVVALVGFVIFEKVLFINLMFLPFPSIRTRYCPFMAGQFSFVVLKL